MVDSINDWEEVPVTDWEEVSVAPKSEAAKAVPANVNVRLKTGESKNVPLIEASRLVANQLGDIEEGAYKTTRDPTEQMNEILGDTTRTFKQIPEAVGTSLESSLNMEELYPLTKTGVQSLLPDSKDFNTRYQENIEAAKARRAANAPAQVGGKIAGAVGALGNMALNLTSVPQSIMSVGKMGAGGAYTGASQASGEGTDVVKGAAEGVVDPLNYALPAAGELALPALNAITVGAKNLVKSGVTKLQQTRLNKTAPELADLLKTPENIPALAIEGDAKKAYKLAQDQAKHTVGTIEESAKGAGKQVRLERDLKKANIDDALNDIKSNKSQISKDYANSKIDAAEHTQLMKQAKAQELHLIKQNQSHLDDAIDEMQKTSLENAAEDLGKIKENILATRKQVGDARTDFLENSPIMQQDASNYKKTLENISQELQNLKGAGVTKTELGEIQQGLKDTIARAENTGAIPNKKEAAENILALRMDIDSKVKWDAMDPALRNTARKNVRKVFDSAYKNIDPKLGDLDEAFTHTYQAERALNTFSRKTTALSDSGNVIMTREFNPAKLSSQGLDKSEEMLKAINLHGQVGEEAAAQILNNIKQGANSAEEFLQGNIPDSIRALARDISNKTQNVEELKNILSGASIAKIQKQRDVLSMLEDAGKQSKFLQESKSGLKKQGIIQQMDQLPIENFPEAARADIMASRAMDEMTKVTKATPEYRAATAEAERLPFSQANQIMVDIPAIKAAMDPKTARYMDLFEKSGGNLHQLLSSPTPAQEKHLLTRALLSILRAAHKIPFGAGRAIEATTELISPTLKTAQSLARGMQKADMAKVVNPVQQSLVKRLVDKGVDLARAIEMVTKDNQE